MYTPDQQTYILQCAREAVGAALSARRMPRPVDCPAYMHELRGCFVTLHHGEQLRGCIGTFEAGTPLIDCIIEMGAAATRDPRFVTQPVTLAELPSLTIEVSVLTPRQRMDNPLDMRIGTDGIYIVDESSGGARSGCFLPQVAPEQGWDAAETLSYCCSHKMGLSSDAWQHDANLAFFRFQAIVLSEKDQA